MSEAKMQRRLYLWVLKIFILSFSAQDAGHSRENDSNYFFIRKMGRAE